MRLDEQVRQIIALNHAWKRQREIHPPNDPIPMMLQARKASMQVELLRRFPGDAYLRHADDDAEHTEALYSVRLKRPLPLNGVIREDAEHLPVRIAESLLSDLELEKFLKR